MKDKKQIMMKALPLFAISLINGGISSVNAVIQIISDTLHVSLSLARMVSTLPSIVVMLVTIIAGSLVEKKLTYRTVVFTGIILFIIGGIAPCFVNNIWILLALRALFGIGLGCFGILNSLYLRTFEKGLSERMVSYGWAVLSVGSIFMKLTAGALGDIDWHYSFLPYGLGFVTLFIFLLRFKEPDYPAVQDTEKAAESRSKKEKKTVRWTPKLIFYVVLQVSAALLIYPVLTGMSTFLAYKKMGSSTLTGILGSIFTVAGIFVGSIAADVSNRLKRFMFPVSYCFMAAAGMASILLAKGSFGICAGCFLCGVANYAILPTVSAYENYEADSESIPVVTSLTWALNNAGLFVSSYVILLADKLFSFYPSSDAGRCYLMALVFYVVTGVVMIFIDVRPDSLKAMQESS